MKARIQKLEVGSHLLLLASDFQLLTFSQKTVNQYSRREFSSIEYHVLDPIFS